MSLMDMPEGGVIWVIWFGPMAHKGAHGPALHQWLRFLSTECFHVFVYQESSQKGRVELFDSHRVQSSAEEFSMRQAQRSSQHYGGRETSGGRRGRIRSESLTGRSQNKSPRGVSTEVLDMVFGTMPLHGESSVKLHAIKGKQLLVTKLFRYCPDGPQTNAVPSKDGQERSTPLSPTRDASTAGKRASGQFVQKRFYQTKQMPIKTKIAVCLLIDLLPDDAQSVQRFICQHFWAVEYHLCVLVRTLLDVLKILRLSDRISHGLKSSPGSQESGSGSGSFRARSRSLPAGYPKASPLLTNALQHDTHIMAAVAHLQTCLRAQLSHARMEAPVWLSTAGEMAKSPIAALSEMLHSLTTALLKDANLLQFVSASITAVVTHHLGWVTALDEGLREKLMGGLWEDEPLRAMLLQSFGCISPSHQSFCRVIVRGENASQVREMLHILSFFVRCPNLLLCHAKSDHNAALKNFVKSQSSAEVSVCPAAQSEDEYLLYGDEEDTISLKVVPLPLVTLTHGKSVTRALYAGCSTSKRGGLFALAGELLGKHHHRGGHGSHGAAAPVTPPRRMGSRNSSLDDEAANRARRARVVQELLDVCAVTPFESPEIDLQRVNVLERATTILVDCDKRACEVFSMQPPSGDPATAAIAANARRLMGFKSLPLEEDDSVLDDLDPALLHADVYHRRVKPSALIASALAMACQAAKLKVDTRACILFIERALESVYSHARLLHEILPLLERPLTVEALAVRLEALSLSSSDVTMLLGIYQVLEHCGALD